MKANPKAIGAFVVGGLFLLIAGIVVFGSFTFFAKRIAVVMYFEGDLTGLDAGAPLMFHGVRIGTVTDVSLHFNTDSLAVHIPVRAEVQPELFVVEGADASGKNLPRLIQQGLRAQLATQSILTGKLLVQLQMRPEEPPRLMGGTDIPEVPTIPSAMAELQRGVQGLLDKLERVPVSELVEDVRTLLRDVDVAVKQMDVKSFGVAAASAGRALDALQGLIGNAGRRIDTLTPAAETTLKNADQALTEARRTLVEMRPLLASLQRTADNADRLLTTANGVIEPGSLLHRELVSLLREFSNTARSVRALADDLERNPDSIVFGKATATGRAK